MYPTRRVLILATLGLALRGLPAGAFSTGVTGYSGKSGISCTGCHGGGSEPEVWFEGPGRVEPGELAPFRLHVRSTREAQNAAGLNVAAEAGRLLVVPDTGTRLQQGEITHVSPKGNDSSGVATFEFQWEAPVVVGRVVLFGAGNSVNGNRSTSGDRALAVQFAVEVGAAISPTATPTPTASPTPTPTPISVAGCLGDCDGDGEVTIAEILRMVNIALGSQPVGECGAADDNGDGLVTVNEIVRAVGFALAGCPPAS